MAALEYPCVSLSNTVSISAGSFNEQIYGIGSALLWTRSNSCQGLTNVVGNNVVSFSALKLNTDSSSSALDVIFTIGHRTTSIPMMENASGLTRSTPTIS
jgi:hypothetical protein